MPNPGWPNLTAANLEAAGVGGQEQHQITREICIDMGHRVTFHGSKCKNVHGHRYRILATCQGPLFQEGEQQGMVIDFGFLKEEMMKEIDEPCDHGLVLWVEDPLLEALYRPMAFEVPGYDRFAEQKRAVKEYGSIQISWAGGKLYLMDRVPTAENLARHWYDRLSPRVQARTENKSTLTRIRVWETPQCYADYGPGIR